MSHIDFAIIGGTGLYRVAQLEDVQSHELETPYGLPSAPLRAGLLNNHRVAFIARHGEVHALPPHRVNYRANLWALKELGAKQIVAVNSVGGITAEYGPGVLACPDQLIDYTAGRLNSFWDGEGEPVHIDFSEPYSASLRARILQAATDCTLSIVDGGCYAATQGPRLESRAEVSRLKRDGCDLVGMTGMPEAALARELGLDYACLAIVANWAAGCAADDEVITMEMVLKNMHEATQQLPELFAAL